MFSKSITNSSKFLMMPQSSQNLYFHLGMNADDDGFCEHFTVMRMTESKPDDLKVLNSKGFVRVFDDKVLVILDWRENNLIRSDRYTPSKYLKEYKKEIENLLTEGLADFGKPMVNQRLPQVRLGKVRLDNNIQNDSTQTKAKTDKNSKEYNSFIEKFNSVVGSSYRGDAKSEKSFGARLKKYTTEEIIKAVENASKNKYLMGENDSNTRYLTPEYILRENKLDQWLNSSESKPKYVYK